MGVLVGYCRGTIPVPCDIKSHEMEQGKGRDNKITVIFIQN